MEEYKYPLALTQQFRFCGNPLRLDFIRGCSFGCIYCYVNARKVEFGLANPKKVINLIKNPYKYRSVETQRSQQKTPIHLGGMSDPFQPLEFKYKLSFEYFKLNYPTMISTKTDFLPEDYYKVLDPKHHVFQISLIGINEKFIRKFENNTPLPSKRLDFMKILKDKGFYVTLRLQPLIDLDESLKLIEIVNDIVDFITIEHIKIPTTNKQVKEYLFKNTPYKKDMFYKDKIHYELYTEIKIDNINKIRKIVKVPIGIGDNDLHGLSDTLNCCGIDLFFDKWLKYNRLYIQKTGDRDVWYPTASVNKCFFSDTCIKGFSYKDYVDDYIEKYPLKIF